MPKTLIFKIKKQKYKIDLLISTSFFFFFFSSLIFSFVNLVFNFQFLSIQNSVTVAIKPTKQRRLACDFFFNNSELKEKSEEKEKEKRKHIDIPLPKFISQSL